MSLEIRIAALEDAVAACNVLRRSIAECCVLDHKNDPAILGAWLGNKTPQMVASWFESPTNYCVVALNDGEVIGVSLLTGAGKLALCYLLPEARGIGAGKAMLARVEETAANWGVKALQLHSTATGAEFFASHGYIRAGRVRSPYGVDTTFFWKQLDGRDAPPAEGATDGEGRPRKRFCNCNSA